MELENLIIRAESKNYWTPDRNRYGIVEKVYWDAITLKIVAEVHFRDGKLQYIPLESIGIDTPFTVQNSNISVIDSLNYKIVRNMPSIHERGYIHKIK